jgi:hypothetical protein
MFQYSVKGNLSTRSSENCDRVVFVVFGVDQLVYQSTLRASVEKKKNEIGLGNKQHK